MKRRIRVRVFLPLMLSLDLLLAGLALFQGSWDLPMADVLQALGGALGWTESLGLHAEAAIVQVRLPRVCMALLGGASLAIAGTIMQAVFRNPLASPEVLGTTQGAALGATVAVLLGWAGAWDHAVPLTACVGAVLVTAAVYLLAGGARGLTVGTLLLAGIAMSTLIGALITFAILRLSSEVWQQGNQILFWLMGSFETVQAGEVYAVGIALLLLGLLLTPLLRDMDLLTLRDTGASSLGVDVVRLRVVLLLIACALTAVTVAFTGGIAFVGLIVPHMARLLVGPAHRGLLPSAAALGAGVLLLADFLCRVPLAGSGLQVGVVMSLMGAPFFLLLLVRVRRGERL